MALEIRVNDVSIKTFDKTCVCHVVIAKSSLYLLLYPCLHYSLISLKALCIKD